MNEGASVIAWQLPRLTAAVSLAIAAQCASALPTVNLTGATYNNVAAAQSGTISNSMGSVVFTRDAVQPAGTGVFNPFLRLDVKGNNRDEQGYNTSAKVSEGSGNNVTTRKVLDNMSPENWTHDVLISDLQLTADLKYYFFRLDINEPGNANSLISLDGLKLFSTSKPSQGVETLNGRGDLSDAALANSTLLWDMDLGATNQTNPYTADPTGKDKSVLLDAKLDKGPGSGVSDMLMLVDRAIIDNAKKTEQYLVLWSRFGLEQAANTGATTADAGFEEWSYSAKVGTPTNPPGPPTPVSAPGTAALALLGLAMMRVSGRGKKNAAAAA